MKLLLITIIFSLSKYQQEPIKKDTSKQKQIVHPKKQGKRKIPYFY